MRPFWLIALLLLPIVPGTAGTVSAQTKTSSPVDLRQRDQKFLEKFRIETTPEGVLAYLQSCRPQNYSPEEARALLARLGHESFTEREKAQQELELAFRFPRELLLAATDSKDLEIRWRTRELVEERGKRDWRGFHAALRWITAEPPPGTLETLLDLAASYHEDFHVVVFDHILPQVVRDEDHIRLLAMLHDADPARRWVVAKLLWSTHTEAARTALLKLAEGDVQSRFTWLAARWLANSGDRRALPLLIRLLASDDRAIASDAADFFQSLTRHEFPFHPADAQARSSQIASLQQWLATQGQQAELHFPVLDSVIQRGNLAGNMLISTGGRGLVAETTPTGFVVWSYPANGWSAEKMRNGNYLIASYSSNEVLEVDASRRVVWRLESVNAMRAKPLPDEHILIAIFSGKRILELDENRNEVWSHTTPDNCFDVERLSNGNTLFACPNLICEITPTGELVRSLEVKGRVNSIQVVPGGNWLIANYEANEIQLYNRKGEKIWQATESKPNDAFRLRNGNTLVTSEKRCVELDRDGQLVRVIQEASYGCARQ